MRHWLAGIVSAPALAREDFVSPPALGDDAGLAGAFALAMAAADSTPLETR
jgi:hypothetical protein